MGRFCLWKVAACASVAAIVAPPALAQAPTGDAPPPEAPPAAAPSAGTSYAPADFARFAPRNAFDMLSNVPGFVIQESDTERRGLGQATGNVLINGERFSGKDTDISTELRRISAANVQRIDIVDGATLNVPGLTGQVANVVTAATGLTGNFVYSPQIRAKRTPARLTNGEVSVSGAIGRTELSASFRNDAFRNGNAGPERVFTPDGTIIDRREEELTVFGDQPRLSATLRHSFENGSILNLNGAGGIFHQDVQELGTRVGPGQPDRFRDVTERTRRYNYEFGGDYEFGIGSDRLKLIGLHRFDHYPFLQTLIQSYADDTPTLGQRYSQILDETETIARAEYRWREGAADWLFSLEGALNKLDAENGLETYDANNVFVPVPFPNATGTVEEKRAESTLTYGRPLADNLTLQASLGLEYSRLTQSGPSGLDRSFYRPKGFVALAWKPSPDLDVSARLAREVGQLNFLDFVASANVSGGTVNNGNANLVPPQSWDAQIEATRNLGPWGTVKGRLYGQLISDIVDVVPIGETGQAPGNLDSATIYGIELTSTFNFDPMGLKGAKLDLVAQFQESSLKDPVALVYRAINERVKRRLLLNFRHDIPASDWAYGASFDHYRQTRGYRLDQDFLAYNRPGPVGVYVEHKDVMGLTVRGSVDNIFGTNESFERTFYAPRRDGEKLFTEARDRYYGPVFTLSVSGRI
ncbi:Outer membrane cobalamin receptor protein [Allosphingosinicella indica]|uniref:Outer membrane cobalamin receptor protein n=2 Tax=Allosphingosinicella indica TaxID=941907 RepID=A0A1X7G6W2_9SPHN|nr:Outer membrane cobalamin receptor protein [Allosphingosinicella indica]